MESKEKITNIKEQLQKQDESLEEARRKEDDRIEKELTFFRRIIGNFHPSKDAKTYAELYQENKELKASQDPARYKELEERFLAQEKEIAELRAMPKPVRQMPQGKSQQPPPAAHTKPEHPLTEEEKQERFRKLLFYPKFTEGQVHFLSYLAMHEDRLSGDDLLTLADFRLSEAKMRTLYGFLCRKNGFQPLEEPSERETGTGQAKAQPKEPEQKSYVEVSVDAPADEDAGNLRVQKLYQGMKRQRRRD